MTVIDGTAGDGRQHDWCQASVLRQRTRCSVDITVPKGGKQEKRREMEAATASIRQDY